MAAPHNTKRYGETWDANEITVLAGEIDALKDLVVVSGGWAWHFMSPPHKELKHAHDHKDVDLFVAPGQMWELMACLAERSYEKTWTRFDGVSDDFHRYTKTVDGVKPVKVILDVFTGDLPAVDTPSGIRVVQPAALLPLYGVKHSSVQCFSVQIARKLMARGIDPNGRPEMADFTEFLKG